MKSPCGLGVVFAAFLACVPEAEMGKVPGEDSPLVLSDGEARADPPTVFRVIAHRGGAALAPENTLPAFRLALDAGIVELELDVRLSRDRKLILFHDASLEEKTGRPGSVGNYPADELVAMDIGSWFDRTHPEVERHYAGTPLTTLEAVFRELGPRPYYHVEIKGEAPESAEQVLALVAAFQLRERVTVTSFSRAHLDRVRAVDPRQRTCWILERGGAADPESARVVHMREIAEATEAGFSEVAVASAELDRALVDAAHARELSVRAWKVRSEADVERVIRSGADGLTTDRPDLALARWRHHHREPDSRPR